MAGEATQEDLKRIYDELANVRGQVGDVHGQVSDVALAQIETATILKGLKEALDKQSLDRALTCPTRPDVNKVLTVAYAIGGKEDPVAGATVLVSRVSIMWKAGIWVGGILVTAAVIPSAVWFFKWIGHAIALAVATR